MKKLTEFAGRGVRVRTASRTRGGSEKTYKDVTDQQRKKFSQAYGPELHHWTTADNLYDDDQDGAVRFARKEGVDPELLKDFQKRLTEKGKPNPLCKPSRLAHYHAAILAGIEIRHMRKGKRAFVSLRTLETLRKSGDVLLGLNRKKQLKRRPKPDTASANH
ncbi:MAG: hypothetical protein H0V18_12255 [Pyrinomonadaceae bacterium]|nr:hypothetical protein [Pyrinomonadaceae bacterium]